MKIRNLDDKYLIEMSVPETANIRVDVIEKDNVLVVSSVNKESQKIEDENRGYKFQMSRTDIFRKVIGLPRNVEKDKIKSNQREGILEITIPKIKERIAK